jgi:hypothetical protein
VVEPFSLGRWGTAALRWWFERVRGVNLPRTDALEEIHRRTSGIPLLVDLFEEVLGVGVADGEGRDLSSSEFDGAIDRYETLFAERVLRLTTGGIEVRLEPRELEILLMVATVHRVGGSEDLCRDLQENWDELFRPMLPVDGLGERDHVALAMVQRLGLLPTNVTRRPALPFERFAPLEPGDLLLRIVDVLAP